MPLLGALLALGAGDGSPATSDSDAGTTGGSDAATGPILAGDDPCMRVAEEGRRVAGALEENSIRSRIGSDELPLDQRLLSASRVAQKAERRLPSAWLDQLGMQRESRGPDGSTLAAAAPVVDVGHWLRAPCEHGQPHSDGQRRRIVELRIDDLAGLMELAGLRPRFLLVKGSIKAAPHWALSLTELLMPHVHSVSSSVARGS